MKKLSSAHVRSWPHLLIILLLCLSFIPIGFAGKRLDKFGQDLKDASISTAVIAKITTSPILSPFKVKVSTSNGIVTLTGLVNTDLQYEQAVLLAQSTKGVKGVKAENLKIASSNYPMKDTLITAKIKGLLLREKILGEEKISLNKIQIETKNGVVYIVGTVDSRDQKRNIIRIAKSVAGVESVKTALKIKN